MGNMLFNRRLGTSTEEGGELVHEEDGGVAQPKSEYRIFKQHMYGGPRGLGDPTYRGLSKMEEDPMIPQRMRDITRTTLCVDMVREFSECSKREGFAMAWRCRDEKDCMVQCQKDWFDNPQFVSAVTEEYLNERSHYRETGIKQKRYNRGAFIMRDMAADPPLNTKGEYRPQKPRGWDDSYPDGPPAWTSHRYE